jgi:ribonuclease Z
VQTKFDRDALVAEVRAQWSGPLILGEDLMAYDLATRTLKAGSATVAFPR